MNSATYISHCSYRFFLLLFFLCITFESSAEKQNVTNAASGWESNAAGTTAKIPVLPLPRYFYGEKEQLSFSIPQKPGWKGLETSAEERLLFHWRKLEALNSNASKSTNTNFQVGILGKDKDFDKLVAEKAFQWINKINDQGYILLLTDKQKIIAATTETGLFYGIQTLKQLVRAGWNKSIIIADWPAFEHRQIYDDISRGPVSTVDYIKKQIERMSEIKINYLSFYIEHVIQPLSHPDFAPENGKLTIAQVKELSAYAAKFYMQLVGSFQSFGHFANILAVPQYASLGATSTLISPTNPKSKKFLADVIGEMCDAFNAPYFNVDCDETFDLGQGTTKALVDSLGIATVYADHLKFLHEVIKHHGKIMMMTGDFPIDHEAVLDMLPKDIIYLTWEYGDQPSYKKWIQPFASRHLHYMVCPGILNTYRMFPDMVMAKGNIRGFTQAGAKQNAEGVITMIWDDGGAYLFSGDWYGVYVTAESSWNTDTAAWQSFDKRYEINAYGTRNGSYVNALFSLMNLRDVPLTYDLNFRLWQQKLLPEKGKELIVNNVSASEALKIITEAEKFLADAKPAMNTSDIQTLSFCIRQYRIMIESRLQTVKIAEDYKKICSSPLSAAQAIPMLKNDEVILSGLIKKYKLLREEFRKAWLNENQYYWLDVVMKSFDKKISSLDGLQKNLKQVEEDLHNANALPAASSIGLGIRESSSFYFQNWMLTGPFPVNNENTFPSFLYSDTKEYDKPPAPGDFTKYDGKLYRWRKFASEDGGIIDLHEYYPEPSPAFVYAYCYISSDTALTAKAFANSNQAMEIVCNSEKVYSNTKPGDSNTIEINLPLKKGINNILLKIRKNAAGDGTFDFHLQDNLQITNHKHKYQLNPKIKSYDAE
ncbi:glycoside hydrolase family 20 zincin-like fold domain-containing protein [Parafilimonas sp.]|uniref:glycoside hydrolase family 20 zincin-like fold domain-containing protein n=1 Tax=Parafilimonas sp. TaxID=1969739 RepID=UPI0039E530D8